MIGLLLFVVLKIHGNTATMTPQFLPPPDSPIHPCYSGVGCAIFGEGQCALLNMNPDGVEWGENSTKVVCRVHCTPKSGSAMELAGVNDVQNDFVCKRPFPGQQT